MPLLFAFVMDSSFPLNRASWRIVTISLCLSICALRARALDLPATSTDSLSMAAPAIRQRGAAMVLEFDGTGFKFYEECELDGAEYNFVLDFIDDCVLKCLDSLGCPEGCCFSRLGGGQILFCQEAGRCVRVSGDTGGNVITATVERYEIGLFNGELNCPLGNLSLVKGRACGLRASADEDLLCEDGLDVPNTGELFSGASCQFGGASVKGANSGTDQDGECFPADASVRLKSGATKRMDELKAGDIVLVVGNKYSEVYMFSHKLPGGAHDFVRIATASGAVVRLTPGHLLSVNGMLAPARSVAAGDAVRLADGRASVVRKVDRVSATGLYNPHTLDGRIAVDGVACTTYTDAVHAGVAHAVLLAPCRAAWRFFGVECAGGLMHGDSRVGVAMRAVWAFIGHSAVLRTEL